MGDGGREFLFALSLFRFPLSPFQPETPDTRATFKVIALMHVYVRRVNFTTKSRFQNIKLRSFA